MTERSLLEDVAAALCFKRNARLAYRGYAVQCQCGNPSQCAVSLGRDVYGDAQAAIDVIRRRMMEPTEEMYEAAEAAMKKPRMHVSHTESDQRASLSIGLQAMLSAFFKGE